MSQNQNKDTISKELESLDNLIKERRLKIHKNNKFSIYEAIENFDNINIKEFKNSSNKSEENKDVINTIMKNTQITPVPLQLKYWHKMLGIIKSIKKTDIESPYPKLPFGKSLTDEEFLDLLNNVILYVNFSLSEDNLKILKEEVEKIESYTENIFLFEQGLKDIKENGILTLIMSKNNEEKSDSISLIKVDICSYTPLINLNFRKDSINYDLNKKEIIEILTSNVLITTYKNTLRNFISKFDNIIKDDQDLKYYINSYINKYNIFFCNLPTNLLAITIHTGNIYLKAKYIKEYYNNALETDLMIVREKIILNIKHEINHALIRELDEEKKNNFFLKNEHNNTKQLFIEFKDKFIPDINYSLPINESGNLFDFFFYKKYYFNNLFIEEANFFLKVKNMKNLNEYDAEFDKMINKEKNSFKKGESVNKFKKSYYNFATCFKSSAPRIIIKKK